MASREAPAGQVLRAPVDPNRRFPPEMQAILDYLGIPDGRFHFMAADGTWRYHNILPHPNDSDEAGIGPVAALRPGFVFPRRTGRTPPAAPLNLSAAEPGSTIVDGRAPNARQVVEEDHAPGTIPPHPSPSSSDNTLTTRNMPSVPRVQISTPDDTMSISSDNAVSPMNDDAIIDARTEANKNAGKYI